MKAAIIIISALVFLAWLILFIYWVVGLKSGNVKKIEKKVTSEYEEWYKDTRS